MSIPEYDVFIAGSGPIGATFARIVLERCPGSKVIMCEIGSQDSKEIGMHHKNSIKYQKDIDAFVHVIQGALQPVSLPPNKDTHMATLGDVAWRPPPKTELVQAAHNPKQSAENNLPGCAITRTVGGMATHWTCACPRPEPEEREKKPKSISDGDFIKLLEAAEDLLHVRKDQYDHSIRHSVVKEALAKVFGKERVENLPLAVKRRDENKEYVTWSGTNTVLGEYADKLILRSETRVTRLDLNPANRKEIRGVLCRNLRTHEDILITAKKYVIACGAVCTPQILHNSGMRIDALGKYLCEQSIAFCQVVLKKELIDSIEKRFPEQFKKHKDKNPNDPLPIPFNDPEPQVTMRYSDKLNCRYHTQIHRDAFSYGDVGPRADPRVIVDLRYFGRQEVKKENCVTFAVIPQHPDEPREDTDIYGMPQATFHVKRSPKDAAEDHKMMQDMCKAAGVLGAFLPGSYPQFMEPGLALHITGTTRIGDDPKDSVADSNSMVHGVNDLYVGGNGCIPDSTACNPTLTSMAYAIKAARHIVSELQK
ncbi:pyranose 2-oxidase [Ceratobasidium sp. AG-I]|nr:pyranose 2-oxidase [Ceratobasidium sp. AG-I]